MNQLEERIAKDGIVREGNVLKVDTLLTTVPQRVLGGCTIMMFAIFPEIIQNIFAENYVAVAVVFVLAVLVNLFYPKKERE